VVEQHLLAKIKKIKLFFSKHKKILISEVVGWLHLKELDSFQKRNPCSRIYNDWPLKYIIRKMVEKKFKVNSNTRQKFLTIKKVLSNSEWFFVKFSVIFMFKLHPRFLITKMKSRHFPISIVRNYTDQYNNFVLVDH
jgi:hypothetical protein